MKKRFLSLLCVLALCLGLLPVTALAEENAPTTLYVGDQSLLVGTNPYWTTDGDGTLTASTESENWNIKYEYSTVTLTLKNATIKGVSDNVNTVGAGIYAASSSGPVSLNIVLEGENKVSGGYGINVSSGGAASLSISGSGSLTVSATATNGIGIFVQAQSGNANLAINGANVNAVVTENNGRGVELSTGQDGNPNLTIEVKGGSLQASGQPNGIIFFTNKNNTQANANLKVSGNAMVKTSGITTEADGSGSQGAVLTTEAGTGETGGIVWNGSEGTVYGSVTLQDDLTIGAGETLTIGDGASLTVPSGKTMTNNGTVTTTGSGTLTNNGTIINKGTLTGSITGKPAESVAQITVHPENVTVTEGATAEFSVTATGENLSYQWQQSTASGQNWTNIEGAIGATYTTGATTLAMNNYQYQCVVSNSAGSVTSDVATLTVKEHVHTWGNPIWNWSEDGKTCTVTFTCEKDENHKENPVVTVTSAIKSPATCTEKGVTTYTATVEFDGKTYTDTKEVADIPATGHSYDNGKCTVCGAIASDFKVIITAEANGSWQKGTKDGLTFTSNAAYKHFQKVQVDGKDLDASNYTVKEGSTIVTLKTSYLETLSVGKHTLAIVSETGTATTEFTIKAAAVTDDTQSPQTGDDSNIALWIAVLLAAGTALTGTAVYSRKRKYSK